MVTDTGNRKPESGRDGRIPYMSITQMRKVFRASCIQYLGIDRLVRGMVLIEKQFTSARPLGVEPKGPGRSVSRRIGL
jgi:hypothetical protein